VHAAVLRLPRTHLAQPSTPVHDAQPGGDQLKGNVLTKPTPFSHRNVISDSDDEDSYTAADHDRRLAYVLPITASSLAAKVP
jgi:hypothetical protein